MAQTASPRAKTGGRRTSAGSRKSPVDKTTSARNGRAANGNGTVKKTVAKKAISKAPALFEPTSKTGKLGRKAIGKVATKAVESGAELIRHAAAQAATMGSQTIAQKTSRRLPIQISIDVAVPLRVAWEEWMALEFLPEGVQTVTEIELDGNDLIGRTRGADWAAEVLDHREQQSFAWKSHEGTDCAGLVTFHQLSERLTRIEVNLDVVPTSVPEAFQLATHVADRRAEADLRRFKARLELMSPDLYERDQPDPHAKDEPDPHAKDEPDPHQEDGDEPTT